MSVNWSHSKQKDKVGNKIKFIDGQKKGWKAKIIESGYNNIEETWIYRLKGLYNNATATVTEKEIKNKTEKI